MIFRVPKRKKLNYKRPILMILAAAIICIATTFITLAISPSPCGLNCQFWLIIVMLLSGACVPVGIFVVVLLWILQKLGVI